MGFSCWVTHSLYHSRSRKFAWGNSAAPATYREISFNFVRRVDVAKMIMLEGAFRRPVVSVERWPLAKCRWTRLGEKMRDEQRDEQSAFEKHPDKHADKRPDQHADKQVQGSASSNSGHPEQPV